MNYYVTKRIWFNVKRNRLFQNRLSNKFNVREICLNVVAPLLPRSPITPASKLFRTTDRVPPLAGLVTVVNRQTRQFRRGMVLSFLMLSVAGCTSTSSMSSKPRPASARAEVHTQLAWSYLQRGQYDVAREELNSALEIDGGSSRAHHIYGLLYNTLGEFSDAQKHFSRAVALNSNNLDAQEDYAGFLCKNGKTEAGVKRYQRVIENPRNNQVSMTRTRVGLCLLGSGKIDEAESFFRDALDSDPSLSIALSAMARISYETGRYLSGRAYVQRYFDIGPDDPQVLYYASNIERKLGDNDSAEAYAEELQRLFPKSREAHELEGG